MADVFDLKWNDFSSNASKVFTSHRERSSFSDVTLVSDDLKPHPAHKIILSACSEYFSSLLSSYSSPNTLTDKSTMIPRGGKGDAGILRPTVMACVPLVLDRIYKGVNETVRKKGEFFENLFRFCVDYKVAALNRGERTPIMDRIIFKNVRALVGGRLRVFLQVESGSGSVSRNRLSKK